MRICVGLWVGGQSMVGVICVLYLGVDDIYCVDVEGCGACVLAAHTPWFRSLNGTAGILATSGDWFHSAHFYVIAKIISIE